MRTTTRRQGVHVYCDLAGVTVILLVLLASVDLSNSFGFSRSTAISAVSVSMSRHQRVLRTSSAWVSRIQQQQHRQQQEQLGRRSMPSSFRGLVAGQPMVQPFLGGAHSITTSSTRTKELLFKNELFENGSHGRRNDVGLE